MKYFLLLPALLFVQFSFSQGAIDGFMKGKGVIDVVPSFGYEFFDEYYSGSEVRLPAKSRIQSYSLYVASGLTDFLDVAAAIPYVRADQNNRGLQDGLLYLKGRFARLKVQKSTLDIMGAIGGHTPIADYAIDSINAIGAQLTSIEPRFILQINDPNGYFASFQTGYSIRLGHDSIPDVFPISLKIGAATAKSYTDIWLDAQIARGGKDFNTSEDPIPLNEIGVSYFKIGGTWYKPLGHKFGFFINASTTISGRNIGKATRVGFGFVFKIYTRKS